MALSALRLWLLLVTILFYAFLVVSSQEDPGDGYEWVYEDVEEDVEEVDVGIEGEVSSGNGVDDRVKTVAPAGIGYKMHKTTAGKVTKTIQDIFLPSSSSTLNCKTQEAKDDYLKAHHAPVPAKLETPASSRHVDSEQQKEKSKEELKTKAQTLEKEIKKAERDHPDPDKIRDMAIKIKNGLYKGPLTTVDAVVLKKVELLETKEKIAEKIAKDKEADKKMKELIATRVNIELGPVCDIAICGACKRVVQGLATAIEKGIGDKDKTTLVDVADSFCKEREFQIQYGKLVNDMCITMTTQQIYKAILLQPFEKEVDYDWDQEFDFSPSGMRKKTQDVCGGKSGVGACQPQEFEPVGYAENEEQLGWTSHCFVCRKIAQYMEQEVVLYSKVTETKGNEIVRDVCSKLYLNEDDMKLCDEITHITPLSRENLAWLIYQHRIDIDDKKKRGLSFPEAACSTVKLCPIWIDSVSAKEIKEDSEFVAVFS